MPNSRIWVLVLALTPLFGHAGLFDDKEARKQIAEAQQAIERLQQTNEQLAERLSQSETSIKGLKLTEVLNQLESLRAELAGLRGQLELQTYQIDQLQKRQKDLYTDVDTRVRTLEENKVQPKEAEPMDKSAAEEAAYSAALDAYKRGDYASSSTGFQRFTGSYPDSKLAANAIYWTAAAHYAQKDCRQAISFNQKLLQQYPDSSKAPDALLGIAACQLENKDADAAKKSLQQVLARYPKTPAAVQAKKQLSLIGIQPSGRK